MVVKITREAREEFQNNPKDFKLVEVDIAAISVKVKQMNTISYAEGKALGIQVPSPLLCLILTF